MEKISGSVSVDMDSLRLIYKAFNGQDASDNDVVYRKILPRFLKIFKKHNIKATFFVIGNETKSRNYQLMIQKMHSDGHEIANHTFSHPFNFSKLPKHEKKEEIKLCGQLIKDITGKEPVGFRAPGWNIDSDTIEILNKMGYLYDSSLYPSYFSYISTLYMLLINRGKVHSKSISKFSYTFAPLTPYHPKKGEIWRTGNMRIFEFPINVTPFLRIPFFGTFLFSTGKIFFDSSYKAIKSNKLLLNYELHAVELYDRDSDHVDQKIMDIRHPAITRRFSDKLNYYEWFLSKFKKDYQLMPIKELLLKIKK